MNIQILIWLKIYLSNIQVIAKAKNHTDIIDSVTLVNIEDNSALRETFFLLIIPSLKVYDTY